MWRIILIFKHFKFGEYDHFLWVCPYFHIFSICFVVKHNMSVQHKLALTDKQMNIFTLIVTFMVHIKAKRDFHTEHSRGNKLSHPR